jgi:hypothetical protein
MSSEEINAIKSARKPRKSKNTKPSLYEKVFNETDLQDFQIAASLRGIDDEIAFLRVKIKFLMESNPQNLSLIMKLIDLLSKLVRLQHLLHKDDKKGFKETLGSVIRDVAVPLGVAVIAKK